MIQNPGIGTSLAIYRVAHPALDTNNVTSQTKCIILILPLKKHSFQLVAHGSQLCNDRHQEYTGTYHFQKREHTPG